jgi:ATP-dependent Clp protease ATP-binding subunit ClpC
VFERFTTQARMAVVRAQEESRDLRHDHIGTSHLLLALLREDGSPVARLLVRHGVDYDGLLARVVEAAGRGDRAHRGHIPFSANAKSALEQADYAAEELALGYVDEPHLLLGLLRVRESHARALLDGWVDDLDAVTIDAVRAARESQPDTAPGSADLFGALLDEYRELAAALGRFGRHGEGCPGVSAGEACRCGLADALARAVGVLSDEPPA